MLPYPIVECSGKDAIAAWANLREQGKSQGFYPVIIGDTDDLQRLQERLEYDKSAVESTIQRARTLKGNEVLADLLAKEPELYEDVEIGEWPRLESHQEFVSHTELSSGRPRAKLLIVKLPTTSSFEALAYLKYGGWNSCPSPEEHVAIHRMWRDRFGAEVVFATSDVIECRVACPPTAEAEALELAREQFVYCSDIVFQGVQTLSNLASSIRNHGVWYFWWD
jgi:hypothetical protein